MLGIKINWIATVIGYNLIALGYYILGFSYGFYGKLNKYVFCALLLSTLMGAAGLLIILYRSKDYYEIK